MRHASTRLALLTSCAATLSLIGAAAAQAETIYMNNGAQVITTEPAYTYTEPAYSYSVQGPLPFSRFVVTEHPAVVATQPAIVATAPAVVAAPPARVTHPRRARAAVVTTPAPAAVVATPAPATVIAQPPMAIVPEESSIVTTGYSTVRSCFTDLIGIERCY